MASNESQKHYDRIGINFRRGLIDEVLPEYFLEDYPNLVTFLEGYYEFLDSDTNFDGIIHELNTIKDVEDASLARLDQMFDTLALGISAGRFKFPREAIRNFGNFFRVKGSQYSGEGFFRAFFDAEVEIKFPKDELFNVGESFIGTEYNKRIQDGGVYQIFSILIKGPLSFKYWEQLWRKYVHPTGFHLANEVSIEGIDTIKMVTDESIPDPFKNIFFVIDSAAAIQIHSPPQAQGEVSHLNNTSYGPKALIQNKFLINDPQFRTNPYRLINMFADSDAAVAVGSKLYPTIQDVMGVYKNLKEWSDWGVTYDNLDSATVAITFDNTFETYDMRKFDTYRRIYIEEDYVARGYHVDNKLPSNV